MFLSNSTIQNLTLPFDGTVFIAVTVLCPKNQVGVLSFGLGPKDIFCTEIWPAIDYVYNLIHTIIFVRLTYYVAHILLGHKTCILVFKEHIFYLTILIKQYLLYSVYKS